MRDGHSKKIWKRNGDQKHNYRDEKAYDGLNSRLHMDEEIISERKDMRMETSKAEKQS